MNNKLSVIIINRLPVNCGAAYLGRLILLAKNSAPPADLLVPLDGAYFVPCYLQVAERVHHVPSV